MSHQTMKYIFDFPEIYSLSDISCYLNLSELLLYKLSVRSDFCYREVDIPKSNGNVRTIACPSKKLKAVQAWILNEILNKIPVENVATAFVKNKNIKTNAEKHVGNRFFICLDIKDFFGSISAKWVYNLFKSVGYGEHISHILVNYCTYKKALPQGGVTSPALSNILCKRLDRRILGYVGARNITYTRYADDITISGNDMGILIGCLEFVERIIKSEGFTLNYNKFRVLRPGRQKKVTGMIINDDNKVTIGRKKVRELRAAIYNLYRDQYNGDKRDTYSKRSNHINGWLNFLKGIDKDSYDKLIKYRNKFQQKFPAYQVAATDEE
ncbi:MAG: retron St85 family RNA-directed DNA polymerase [bacterium]